MNKKFKLVFAVIVVFLGISRESAAGSAWPMRQRDGENTGRADFIVPAARMGSSFFGNLKWQKPTPADGAFTSSGTVYFDGVGPGGADIVVGGYHWPKGIQGMDRHTGKLFWSANPGGGETIGVATHAFAPDGHALYVVNDATERPLVAFAPQNGPIQFWHNGSDPEPARHYTTLKVAPDGRLFSHHGGWANFLKGATDFGTNISATWTAASSVSSVFSLPAITTFNGSLRIIGAGEFGLVKAFDGATGAEIWSAPVGMSTDADPTVDPQNGNIYVPIGNSSIAIAGLRWDGAQLWGAASMPVYTSIPGENTAQRAIGAGCLAHDGKTFYFQTVSPEGDGKLYAINTTNGSVKWSFPTASKGGQGIYSSPIVTPNGVVIVGNNDGGIYFAIHDMGANGQLLAALPAEQGGFARAALSLSPDGLIYLPARLKWTAGNGDGETPTQEVRNLFNAFDLNEIRTPTPHGELSLGTVFTTSDSQIPVPVMYEGTGVENSFSFSVQFDPAMLAFSSFAPSEALLGGLSFANTSKSAQGLVGIVASRAAGQTIPAGMVKIGELHFSALSAGASAVIQFSDDPVQRQVVTADVELVGATYESGRVNITPRRLEIVNASAVQSLRTVLDIGVNYMEVLRVPNQEPLIYWSLAEGTIWRSKLDGSNRQLILTGAEPERIGGIAFDVAAGHFYSGTKNSIFRANLDGSGRVDLTPVSQVAPGYTTDVELDLVNGKIYWGDGEGVHRANLDGSAPQLLRPVAPGNLCEGIALDIARGKVYHMTQFSLDVMNLDGTSPTTIQALGAASPYEVEIDLARNKIFWEQGLHPPGVYFASIPNSNPSAVAFATPINNGFHYDPIESALFVTTGTEVRRFEPFGGEVLQTIRFVGAGNENAWAFTLEFAPQYVRFLGFETTAATVGATLFPNTSQAAAGKVGVLLGLPAGQALPPGTNELLRVRFQSLEPDFPSVVFFASSPVAQEVVSVTGTALPFSTINGEFRSERRTLRFGSASATLGSSFTLPIHLTSYGNDALASCVINFDATQFDFLYASLPPALSGGTISATPSAGQVNLSVIAKAGTTFPAGEGEIALLQFFAKGISGPKAFSLSPGASVRDRAANLLDLRTLTGEVIAQPPLLPSILVSPIPASAIAGASAQFRVTASSQLPLFYQWRKDDQQIPGATDSILNLVNTSIADEGIYTVEVRNSAGVIVSSAARFTLLRAPQILVQPVGYTALAGESVQLSVQADGSGPLTYEWSANNVIIFEASGPVLTIGEMSEVNIGNYKVTVRNSQGQVTSDSALLQMVRAPAINAAPVGGTRKVGGSITFTVNASGTPPLRYQWKLNGQNIPDATASSYTINNVKLGDAGLYTVTVANDVGAITTDPVELVVEVPPAPAQDHFANATQLTGSFQYSGNNATATAEPNEPSHARRTPNHSVWFKWSSATAGRLNVSTLGSSFDTVIAIYRGATLATLNSVVADDDGGPNLTSQVELNVEPNISYYIAIDGFLSQIGQFTGNYVITGEFTPTANRLPVITSQPQSFTRPAGSPITLTVVTDGADLSYTYQWFFNDRVLPGETAASLLRANLSAAEVGNYYVEVRNQLGLMTRSDEAIVEIGLQTEVRSVDKPESSQAAASRGNLSRLTGAGAMQVSFGGTVPHIYNLQGGSEQFGSSRCSRIGGKTRYLPVQATAAGTLVIRAKSSVTCNLSIRDGFSPRTIYAESCAGTEHRLQMEVPVGFVFYIASDSAIDGPITNEVFLGKAPTFPAVTLADVGFVQGQGALLTAPNVTGAIPAASYQWYRNGASIQGATAVTYLAVAPGKYSVLVWNPIAEKLYDIANVTELVPLRMSAGKSGNNFNLTLQGNVGQSFILSRTSDFQNWQTEDLGWLGDDGQLDFAADLALPRSFYYFQEFPLANGITARPLTSGFDVSIFGGRAGNRYVLQRRDGAGPWVNVQTNSVKGFTYHFNDPISGGGQTPQYRAIELDK